MAICFANLWMLKMDETKESNFVFAIINKPLVNK